MNENEVKNIIENIFRNSGCEITECSFSDENGMFWYMIKTPDSRVLIGKDGETLRSLNHVIRKIAEKNLGEEVANKIFIDINEYQQKRLENLKNIAHMMAERARYFKSNIEIDPMPAYERKVVHMFLENLPDIKTESEGTGPNRRIVIKYIGNI